MFISVAIGVVLRGNPLFVFWGQGDRKDPSDQREDSISRCPKPRFGLRVSGVSFVRDIALVPWSKGLMVPKNQDEVTEERPSDQRDRGTNKLTDERTSRGQYRFVVLSSCRFVISSVCRFVRLSKRGDEQTNRQIDERTNRMPHRGTEYGCSTLRGKRAKQKNGYIYEKSFTISIGCHFYDDHSLGTRARTTICVARV